jgi:hypothetical protein
MWAKLDDAMFDHPKLVKAGRYIGRQGFPIAVGTYTLGLLYAAKHLTDGRIPLDVVRDSFRLGKGYLSVAQAMTKAHLWESYEHGYVIHDYQEWNGSAADIKAQRVKEKARKHQARWRKK